MTDTKTLVVPHSKESEMMVLGCMLTNPKALTLCIKILTDNDFFFTEHQTIFQSLKSTWKMHEAGDIHLLSEELKRQNKLKSVGGLAYITDLAQYAGTSAYVEEYIDELKNHSKRRQIILLATDLQQKAVNNHELKELILHTQESLKLIEKNRGAKNKLPIRFLSEFEENFLLAEPQKKEMLLEYAKEDGKYVGFLPKGIVAMLVGAGGVGKTHLLAQLAIAVATGTPFLNTFTPTKHCGKNNQGNVFIGLGENQYDDIHRLLYKATKHLRIHHLNSPGENALLNACKRIAPFSFCGQQAAFIDGSKPSVYFREFKMRMEDTAPPNGWQLIILDPVSRLMGTDAETDNAAATQFIALLEELTIDLPGNPTILFAHHMNKASMQQGAIQNQTAARGASALTDGVRWQCNYTKDASQELVTLKITKSNFTPLIEEIKTKKDSEGYIEKCTISSLPKKIHSSKNENGNSKNHYLSGLGIAGINDD